MSKIREVLAAVDPQVIAQKIVTPCKMAEQTYKPKHLLPQDYEEFLEDCAAFWVHLNKSAYGVSNLSMSQNYAGGMALKYIDEAFRQYGGVRYAYEKAREMTFGYIKYAITEQFIGELSSTYTGYILRSMINPYDYQEISSLMKEYVKEFNIPVSDEGEFQMMIANYSMILHSHVKHHADMMIERKIGHHV